MRKNTAIKQIKLLQTIKPSKDWSEKTRSILLAQISAQGFSPIKSPSVVSGFKAYGLTFWSDFYRATVGMVFSRPRNAFAAFGVLAVMGFFAYTQAQHSLPGEPLYTVKQTEENIKVAFASPQDRPSLELSLIEKRIQELETLTGSELDSAAMEKGVTTLVDSMSENFKNAEHNLDSLKSQEEPKKIVHIASLVKEKAGDYRKALRETLVTQSATSSKELLEKIGEAVATADSANTHALEVIVDKGASAGVSESEVAAHLNASVKEIEDDAKALKETVSMAALTSPDKKRETLKKSKEATKILKEAKESIKQKDFKVALFKLTQGKELVDAAQDTIGTSASSTDMNTPADATSTPDTKIKLIF